MRIMCLILSYIAFFMSGESSFFLTTNRLANLFYILKRSSLEGLGTSRIGMEYSLMEDLILCTFISKYIHNKGYYEVVRYAR